MRNYYYYDLAVNKLNAAARLTRSDKIDDVEYGLDLVNEAIYYIDLLLRGGDEDARGLLYDAFDIQRELQERLEELEMEQEEEEQDPEKQNY